jgi:hypothetical protein
VLLRNTHACGDADAFALVLTALADRADSHAYEQLIQLLANQVHTHTHLSFKAFFILLYGDFWFICQINCVPSYSEFDFFDKFVQLIIRIALVRL